MRKKLLSRFMLLVAMLLTGVGSAWAEEVTDVLDYTLTGITSTSYTTFSGKQSNSDAVYAGQCAGSYNSIQLRSKNNDSGVISTTSGGNLKSISITWNTNTVKGRSVYIYGKTSAYSEAANLFNGTYSGKQLAELSYDGSTTTTSYIVNGDYQYIGIRSVSSALYIDKIEIVWETGGETDTRAEADLSFDPTSIAANLGEEFIAPTLNNPNNLTVTWTSDNANVAEVATDGTVTLKGEGTAEITATFEGNDEYKPGSASYTITVTDPNKPGATAENPYTVAQALEVIEEVGTTGTPNDVYVKGIISRIKSLDVSQYKRAQYYISDDGSETDEIYVYNGYYLNGADFTANDQIQVGDIVVIKGKILNYNSTTPEINQNSQIVSLDRPAKDPVEPTMVIPGDAIIKYGESFTLDTKEFLAGPITLESANEKIATVDGLTVFPLAVGQVTITVKAEANDTYLAGEGAFTLVIENPDVETSAPAIAGEVIFTETFDKIEGTGGNDNTFSGSIATNKVTGSGEGQNTDKEWTIGDKIGGAYQCLKFGTGSVDGVFKTTVTITGNAILSFRAAGWSTGTNKLTVTTENATLSGDTYVELTNGEWTNYEIAITDAKGSIELTFNGRRGFIDDIKVALPSTEVYTETATLNGNGFATHASIYPLDFSAIEGATAWIATAIEGTTITFEQLNAPVAGGTGVLLKGEPNAEVTIPGAEKGEEADGNIFIPTLAPTYVVDNQYYGLYNENFVRVSESVAKENKALLPAGDEEGVKAFTLVFNGTDGVKTIETVSAEKAAQIFDLSGRRLSRTQKGVNIINGKKVMVK